MTIGTDDDFVPTATDRNSAQQLWSAAQEELRFQLARPSYETWLATATLVESDGQRFLIGVCRPLHNHGLASGRLLIAHVENLGTRT